MKSPFCMPRLRAAGNACTRKNNRLSPMSLLDRFREAVFRLIMLSALSKDATSSSAKNLHRGSRNQNYSPHDPHHSEAVAECIEFIKKSAISHDHSRSSTASTSIDASLEVVLPVPVIS